MAHNFEVRHELLKVRNKVRVRRFKKGGYEHFRVRLYVTGDLDELDGVEYELHSSFKRPVSHVSNSEDDFSLEIWTWGEFDVHVTFFAKDGSVTGVTYNLQYSAALPPEESAYHDETSSRVGAE